MKRKVLNSTQNIEMETRFFIYVICSVFSNFDLINSFAPVNYFQFLIFLFGCIQICAQIKFLLYKFWLSFFYYYYFLKQITFHSGHWLLVFYNYILVSHEIMMLEIIDWFLIARNISIIDLAVDKILKDQSISIPLKN